MVNHMGGVLAVDKDIFDMSGGYGFMKKIGFIPLFYIIFVLTAAAQQKLPHNTGIPPNYDYYTLNPEYTGKPQVLGWAVQRIEERLDRGLIAVPIDKGKIYLGWRLLKTDPEGITFNIYRSSSNGDTVKLNAEPIRQTTDFIDTGYSPDLENRWLVKSVLYNKEQKEDDRVKLPSNPPIRQYQSVQLRDDLSIRSISKVALGDLDGDGRYEFIVKRPGGTVDPGKVRKSPDTFKIEAYDDDGRVMWRNDLGWSIELGVWYSPMVVWDFNGDGKSEIALKTGEGDPRDRNGQVLTGPEYLSVWNGENGKEISRIDWIPRGKPEDWGDVYGNRMNRNMMAVAYLDGKTPSCIVQRGTYGLMKMEAWILCGDKLQKAWNWSNQTSGWRYQGQGAHTMNVADIDGDGCDEILNGGIVIDNDGRIVYSNGMGHADRFFVTDVDPDRPGLESVYCFEDPHPKNGLSLWDALSGELIAGVGEETRDNQVGQCLVADIDPSYPGMEWWGDAFFFTSAGQRIHGPVPPQDGLVWWDADPLREIQSRGTVSKWNGPILNKNIEGRVMAWADILGDWREEIVTHQDGELRIYTTILPAEDRRVCLMQDPLYRSTVAFKAMGYDQPPMTGYFLGSDYGKPSHGTACIHEEKQKTSFRFDFGSGKQASGTVQILPTTAYSESTGYGFDFGSSVFSIDRGGEDALRGDFCSGDRPFFFSVRVPEGNYRIVVTLGDAKGVSATTIRAESRRLMVENVKTEPGQFKNVAFMVNVRDSLIHPEGKVRLKPRERTSLNWDDKLTIEFNGVHPCVCALELTRVDDAVTVYLAGNSTVVDQASEPWAAWGQMIPRFFKPDSLAISNHAESGEALKSFVAERRLEKILSTIKAGDYLFIEFAHNDQKQGSAYLEPFSTYKEYLRMYIHEARKHHAIPVLVTSMHRRNFDQDGKIVNTLGDYPEAMRQTAKEENVALIDLNTMSKVFYEAMGLEKSVKAFVHYPAGTFPGQKDELKDNTHFNAYGAYELAKCIVEGIKTNNLGIARYLVDDMQPFNPAQPDPADGWSLPMSPPMIFARPDGR
jgi:lysophospholipase L1-like esterase